MKSYLTLFIFTLLIATTCRAQHVMEPIGHGTVQRSGFAYFTCYKPPHPDAYECLNYRFNEPAYSVEKPDIHVYRYWSPYSAYAFRSWVKWTAGMFTHHGVIEFDLNQTVSGVRLPLPGMTPYNWTAQLTGMNLTVNKGAVDLYSMNSSEDGVITESDYSAAGTLLQNNYSGQDIDITEILREDLFHGSPVNPSLGFLLTCAPGEHLYDEVDATCDHLSPQIVINGTFPTPTPFAEPLGVKLHMPTTQLYPGATFSLKIDLNNPGIPRINVPLFVILDVHGNLYYYPQWTEEMSFKLVDVDLGRTQLDIINTFDWPKNTGSASGVYFHAAMLNQSMTDIIGEYDSLEFGWQE